MITKTNNNSKLLSLIFIMLLLVVLVEIVVVIQLSFEYKRRQSLIVKNVSQSNANIETQKIMDQFIEDIPKINKGILTEAQFPEIVDKINNRIVSYPESIFKFDSNESIKIPNSNYTYYLVSITAVLPSIEEAHLLVRDLVQNPYLFTIQDLELNRRPDNQSYKINLRGRLYAQ